MIVGVNVKLMSEGGLTPNEAFYLWNVSKGEDGWKNMCNLHFLEQMNYIEANGGLTELGKVFVHDVFLPVKKPVRAVGEIDVKDLSLKYRELFPVGVKTGNFPVRGNIKNIERKMELFRKKYPDYSDELILKVTEKYVKDKAREGYAFMKMAEYLILKDNESVLASLCDAYNEGDGGKERVQWGRTV